jgi:hypothetical protein
MGRGIGDGKVVIRFAGAAVKEDEGGDARGVNALDGMEIEGEVLPANEGLQMIQQGLVVAPDELSQAGDLDRLDVAFGRPKPDEGNKLKSREIRAIH